LVTREEEREGRPLLESYVKRASLAMVNNLLTSTAAFIPLYNNAAETRTVPFAIEQRAIGNTSEVSPTPDDNGAGP